VADAAAGHGCSPEPALKETPGRPKFPFPLGGKLGEAQLWGL